MTLTENGSDHSFLHEADSPAMVQFLPKRDVTGKILLRNVVFIVDIRHGMT